MPFGELLMKIRPPPGHSAFKPGGKPWSRHVAALAVMSSTWPFGGKRSRSATSGVEREIVVGICICIWRNHEESRGTHLN